MRHPGKRAMGGGGGGLQVGAMSGSFLQATSEGVKKTDSGHCIPSWPLRARMKEGSRRVDLLTS